MQRSDKRTLGLAAVWLLCVATGFGFLLRYKNTPGPHASGTPGTWPRESSVPAPAGRPTLVMFAHPHCPCTQASVSELARMMVRYPDRMDVRVLLVSPTGVAAGWDDTSLRERVSSIPGVWVGHDAEGREAARFGALVSGFSLLYDANARLVFAGGLTSMRGHEGDSAGLRQIAAALDGRPLETHEGPTFGCALHDPSVTDGT